MTTEVFQLIGPFSPQELENMISHLKEHQVGFEIQKDEEEERLEMRDDFANAAKKADWRTETYLGQIFYLKILRSDYAKVSQDLIELGLPSTSGDSGQETQDEIEPEVKTGAFAKKRLQRTLALLAVGFMVLSVLVGFLFEVFTT